MDKENKIRFLILGSLITAYGVSYIKKTRKIGKILSELDRNLENARRAAEQAYQAEIDDRFTEIVRHYYE